MKRCGFIVSAVIVAVGAGLSPVVAHADVVIPALEAPCPAELDGVMTLLAEEQTYAVCQEGTGTGYAWSAAPMPFEPNSMWLSYGPAITLHGQGMRNPNLTSGQWTATPRDADTVCRVQQETVVEAGVLSAPEVFEGQSGQPLSVEMLPQLFYAQLSGNCLWTED